MSTLTATLARPRTLERLEAGMPTSDGGGAKLTRLPTHTL